MKRGDPNGLAALNEAAREPLLDNLYTERAQMLPYDERVEFPYDKGPHFYDVRTILEYFIPLSAFVIDLH